MSFVDYPSLSMSGRLKSPAITTLGVLFEICIVLLEMLEELVVNQDGR